MTATATKGHRDSKTCQLYVGTSGFSYAEWVDAGFYPSGTKSGKMLQRYARNFLITELNYTRYRMPKIENRIEPLSGRARKGVIFFNNHVRAQAPENARRMVALLKERGLMVV